MSQLDLSRWQFALTVLFHMTFPAITVGLSIFLSVVYGLHWKTGNPVYLQMFRFWRRIFAVGFAIGVVAGIVITFEMGLNWGVFASKTGPIIAPIIAMEVVTAFFVEAGFIGIMLYGDGRVRQGTMFVATVMVAIGTLLSSSWIVAANSWMQTPAGFAVRNGRFEPTNRHDAILNLQHRALAGVERIELLADAEHAGDAVELRADGGVAIRPELVEAQAGRERCKRVRVHE
jgi:cytochrome d ubiquinol oxidase subunit I